jgi:hypothetical protein
MLHCSKDLRCGIWEADLHGAKEDCTDLYAQSWYTDSAHKASEVGESDGHDEASEVGESDGHDEAAWCNE